MSLRPSRTAGAVLIALTLLALSPSIPGISGRADAQTSGARFVYELCDAQIPGGSPAPVTFAGNPAYKYGQNCAVPGGAVGIYPEAAIGSSVAAITVVVQAPPGGYVESDTVTAGLENFQPGNIGFVVTEGWPPADGRVHTRTFPFRSGPPPSCDQCDVGGSLEMFMGCMAGSECPAGGVVAADLIAATEVDPVPPSIGAIEGSLLTGGTIRGHRLVSASASDLGGGLSDLEILVNGVVAPGAVPGTCSTAFVSNPSYTGVAASSPTPCPRELKGTWNLDTAEPPFHEGANGVQVCASDFATIGSANTTCSATQTVTVDDSCTGSPVSGGRKIEAGFKGGGGGDVTVPFEESAEVTGELTTDSGSPVSGATICVQTQVAGVSSEPRTLATVTTSATGSFNYDLPAGPNRDVVLGYRDDSFQVEKTLTFGSQVKPMIALSRSRVRRGHTVGIAGVLPGPASAGRVVVLQASALHGKRWLTFRKATTGERGGFRAEYRFGGTSGTTTYRIRALVPRQSGYPWEPGHSVPKRIKVFAGEKRGAGKKSVRHRHRRKAAKDKTNDKHPHGGVGA